MFFRQSFPRLLAGISGLETALPPLCAFKVMTRKASYQGHMKKRQKTGSKPIKHGSNDEVLLTDIRHLIATHKEADTLRQIATEDEILQPLRVSYTPQERFTEIEVKILELSSTGDGLGLSSKSDNVYVVPFTVPGDFVKAKVVNHFAKDQYTLTDFVKVVESAPQRDDALIRCPYFAKCSGCQLQMLPYEDQLKHKRTIIEKAYRNFSTLTPDIIPAVGETIGSPLQYGYRTKLTPHFDGPPGCMSRQARRGGSVKAFDQVPPIGFMLKGTRKTIDIEECPIGTDAVKLGLQTARKKVADELSKYKKGATICLRESTSRRSKDHTDRDTSRLPTCAKESAINVEAKVEPASVSVTAGKNTTQGAEVKNVEGLEDKSKGEGILPYIEEKICITDQNAIATEFIDDFVFHNPAGSFFQNNNSILPTFTAYIRNHILPIATENELKPIRHLIDAYCGSGLFTVTLSSLFSSSLGIDIAGESITSAKENATANKISNASFMAADASAIFKEVTYPADQTVVVIDPPRKGCDEVFLQQLLQFGPLRVVYVSCNVHTQARDVGRLVEGGGKCRYEIESLQGFDFFPQTGHVEGVAILTRSKTENI